MRWNPGEMHRCEECIRPICQCKFTFGSFNGEVSQAMNDYTMHDLFAGA